MKPLTPAKLAALRAGYAQKPATSLVRQLLVTIDERDAEITRLQAELARVPPAQLALFADPAPEEATCS